LSTQLFITNDMPNVAGLVLAGLADFKTDLAQSDMFDPRLKAVILTIVDVSYGGENGFNQAIELAADCLSGVKFIQEKKLLTSFMDELAKDTGKYCIGVKETLHALELGAVETLIVYENLDVSRYVLKNVAKNVDKVVHLTKEQAQDHSHFEGPGGEELDVVSSQLLVEWFADNYKSFGAKLEFVTNKSQEGSQFVKGFGGVGGLLRYKVDFDSLDNDEIEAAEGEGGDDESDHDDDEDFFL